MFVARKLYLFMRRDKQEARLLNFDARQNANGVTDLPTQVPIL